MFYNFQFFNTQLRSLIQKQYNLFYTSFLFFQYILENFFLVIRFHFYALELITINNKLFDLLVFLKSSFFFSLNCLLDIVVKDYLIKQKLFRFSITYILLSVKYNFKCYITFFLKEFNFVPSILKIYKNANWSEREVWDMFGIFFYNHSDLRRILTDYNFYYFPLRKDFPLTGFFELYYDERKQQLVLTPVSLSQEYRFFSLKNVWKAV